MDNVTIKPAMLKGKVNIPPSKSMAHRAVIAAALSEGDCVVSNISMSQDISATLGGLRALGYKYSYNQKQKRVKFNAGRRKLTGKEIEIDCGESGSTLRFLIPIALLTGKDIKFICHGRLLQRPMKPYFDMFDKCGITYEIGGDYIRTKGKLKPGVFMIAGNISSQFISGLLFALPLLDKDSEIVITESPESTGYVDMTLDTIDGFGIKVENKKYLKYVISGNQSYKAKDMVVEGDYSQAAFFLTAGAIGCDIECLGLPEHSLQGDREIIDIVKRAGGKIEKTADGIKAKHTANMHGITVDARNIPDLIPTVAVMLSFCKGESNIINAGRLRMKESDRLSAICDELSRLGINIQEGGDYIKINGGQTASCQTVSARNDHRIAMALAIATCRCEGDEVIILGAQTAVKKSYPDFFDVYETLR